MIPKDTLHEGHRQRMRDKFCEYGERVFHTHELLEMLLFCVIPYKNTNPIAKNLLARFQSLDGVFSATREELVTVDGVGPKVADFLLSVGEFDIFSIGDLPRTHSVSLFDDYTATGRYFVRLFEGKKTHEIYLMLLDSKMSLITVKKVCDLDYSSGAVRSKLFIDEIIKNNAAVAIIAHNHPYSTCVPSEGDIATNDMLEADIERAGALLLEHYIVSGNKFYGFMSHSFAFFSQVCGVSSFLRSKEAEK